MYNDAMANECGPHQQSDFLAVTRLRLSESKYTNMYDFGTYGVNTPLLDCDLVLPDGVFSPLTGVTNTL